MKKIFVTARALYLCILVLLFTGCQKIYDHYVKHRDFEVKKCQISQIHAVNDHIDMIWKFTYNENNDPVLVERNGTNSGFPDPTFFYSFAYDDKNRLIEYREYGNPEEPVIHRYAYNNKNQIIRDTFISPSPHEGILEELTYDHLGRVATEKWTYLYSGAGDTGEIFTLNYIYDERGNIIQNAEVDPPESEDYDNKISFLRTNKIWMFLTRDYSVNNRRVARSYNQYHLPTGFDQPVTTFLNASGVTDISYQCRGKD